MSEADAIPQPSLEPQPESSYAEAGTVEPRAPGVPPDNLPAFTSTLWAYEPYPAATWQQNLQYRGSMQDMASSQWRRLSVGARMTGSTDTTDYAWIHFDFAKQGLGAISGDWQTADYTAIETAFGQFCQAWLPFMGLGHEFFEQRWYRRGFNTYAAAGTPDMATDGDPATEWKPFAESGAPVRVTPMALTGSSASQAIWQNAVSLTFRNVSQRHWGRTYLPFPGGGLVDSTGQMTSGNVDTIAAALQAFANTCATGGRQPVVATTRVQASGQGKGQTTAGFGLLTWHKVQVDSVPDIVRRRRPSITRHRATLP